ncbi:hypothetical protein [Natrononativus amylolyticus]|uniref:hypothetical protein n=1 Tax=Natrononativus amylolyticus TaxID=2963434 RepID=UPI0020CC0DF4|nr:hypothetical protein [Natrononativus amylolyticus]
MAEENGDPLSTDEFVEYCRTQAGLLAGSVETIGAEIGELLDEIDDEMAEIRSLLEEREETAGPTAPSSPTGPDAGAVDVATIEELEAGLETKQSLVEAKQARMNAFQELAADYTELAESLPSEADDGREAMELVVRFELERDAPAYFPDRQTVCEAAAAAADDEPSERRST